MLCSVLAPLTKFKMAKSALYMLEVQSLTNCNVSSFYNLNNQILSFDHSHPELLGHLYSKPLINEAFSSRLHSIYIDADAFILSDLQ